MGIRTRIFGAEFVGRLVPFPVIVPRGHIPVVEATMKWERTRWTAVAVERN